MNETEHIAVVAAEECGEVADAALLVMEAAACRGSDADRTDNFDAMLGELVGELNDLFGTVDMLIDCGVALTRYPTTAASEIVSWQEVARDNAAVQAGALQISRAALKIGKALTKMLRFGQHDVNPKRNQTATEVLDCDLGALRSQVAAFEALGIQLTGLNTASAIAAKKAKVTKYMGYAAETCGSLVRAAPAQLQA